MDPDSVASVPREPHGGHAGSGEIEFSANVNPETPPGTERVYERALAESRSYPAEPPTEFRRAAGASLDVDPDRVIPTPGGLAAIRLAIETVLEPGDVVLVPRPGFGEYEREVALQGAETRPVPADEILATRPGDHDMAIVCTPNNPTGRGYDRDRLREFVARHRAADTPVLVDEAFLGFEDRETIAGTDGAIVARSLTKLYGLPGLRVGYAVATGDLRDRLFAARRPWNVGGPALAVGEHALRQDDFVRATRRRVRHERERLRDALSERFEVAPSSAPFLLLAVTEGSVDAVLERAAEGGIVLRDARTFETLDAHVRVAIRRREENDRLLEVLLDG
ncbi:MAG: aminotransferase class I/II-fold pyridoxal phosphate-dependent enzyme [Halanaeroarchaeum sp.]